MTKKDQQEFKSLIKEGTLEALESKEGQNAVAGALRSEAGQDAIAEALRTDKAKDAIAEALTTEKAKDAILDVFVEAFHEVVVPVFEDQNKKIERLERKVGLII